MRKQRVFKWKIWRCKIGEDQPLLHEIWKTMIWKRNSLGYVRSGFKQKLWNVKMRTQKNLAGILRTENKPSKIAMENRCEGPSDPVCKSVRKIEKTGKESIVKLFFSDSFPPPPSLSFSIFSLSAFTVLSPSFTYWSMLARFGEISFEW